jgi:hypothetical protein
MTRLAHTFVALIGAALVIFSSIMIFQPNDWMIKSGLIVTGAFGLALVLVAVALFRGAKFKDAARDLFTGLLGL